MKWHSLRMGALAALVVATIGPTPGMAQQQFNWDYYCTVGSLQMCASVELTLTPSLMPLWDSPSTDVAVRIRNLEGTVGSTPFFLEGVGFHLGGDYQGWGSVSTEPAALSGTAGFYVRHPGDCDTYGLQCPGPGWGNTWWYYYGAAVPKTSQTLPGNLWMEIAGSGAEEQGVTIGCDVPSSGFAPGAGVLSDLW